MDADVGRARTLLPLAFVVVSLLVLLVGPAVVTWRTTAIRREIGQQVEPARRVAEEILAGLALEVSLVRGYLVTGDETLVRRYLRARRVESARLARLRDLARTLDRDIQVRARRVERLALAWARPIQTPLQTRDRATLARVLPQQQVRFEELVRAGGDLNLALSREAAARRAEIDRLDRFGALLSGALALVALLAMGAVTLTARQILQLAQQERLARRAVAREAELLEERVEERTAELKAANARLDDFAHTVSHDLRAPVRSVAGFSEALREDAGQRLGPGELDHLDRIQRAADQMDRLIDELLAYSRLSNREITLQPVRLDAVVTEALGFLRREISERGAEVTVRPPLPAVVGHRATLTQAVQNLLSNAVKFVPPGAAARVTVFAEQRNGRTRLWVEDDGIGIDPRHQDRIFRVFERLHGVEAYPGTGIGLAIVARAVERMGGAAGVESELGRGSRFWIELQSADGA